MRNYCLRNERSELVVFVLHSHSSCSFFLHRIEQLSNVLSNMNIHPQLDFLQMPYPTVRIVADSNATLLQDHTD
jgi:hypothetical protein